MKFKDLYNFLDKKCNFHEKEKGKPETMTWKCNGFQFVKEFCKKNKIDYKKLLSILNNNGAFCDCEVLFNVTEHIKETKNLPKK